MTTSVMPWTTKLTRPSWSRVVRASMSLVIRVIRTPDFSLVKKSSDWRW